jgi:hypothetical protein
MVTLQVLKSHLFLLSGRIPLFFSRFCREIFGLFGAFSRVFSRVLVLFCPFVLYLSISGILLYFLHSFKFFLTVRCLRYILSWILHIIDFFSAVEVGIFVISYFWTTFEIFILFVIFGKSIFLCRTAEIFGN